MINPESLIDLLYDHGFEGEYAEDETEIRVACSLCADDNKRLYIEAESGAWLCFKCDERGDLFDLFHRVLGLDVHQAFEALRQVRHRREQRYRFTEESRNVVGPSVVLPVEFEYVDLTGDVNDQRALPYVNYLKSRAVSLKTAQAYHIGFCPTGVYARRVIIPIDEWGLLYSFVARSIDADVKKKVLYPPRSRGSETLFNLRQIRELEPWMPWIEITPTVIVEGVFDALRMPEKAVALLGSSISPRQATLLAQLPPTTHPFIVMMDGDEAGHHASRRIMKTLFSHMLGAVEARLPDGLDPSSAPEDILQKTISEALDKFRSEPPV